MKAATPSISPTTGSSEPPLRLRRILLGLVLAVTAFDICFWHVNDAGLSVAVFVLTFAALVLFNRETGRRRCTFLILSLIVGASVAALIETSATNFLVLVWLIVGLGGETFFEEVPTVPRRCLCQFAALFAAPGRAVWLAGCLFETAWGSGTTPVRRAINGCVLTLPALFLGLIFGSLLASGNAVFGSWTNSYFDWFWKALFLYLNPSRLVLWALVAGVALPLLRPTRLVTKWFGRANPSPFPTSATVPSAAILGSAIILIILNLLFLVANVADALFLWTNNTLPLGVTYSEYVHHGVNSLVIVVLLSAVVLAGIFQVNLTRTARRGLVPLGLFWIAQNLFLLVGVILRLKLYIEAYDMTVARLSVILFLLLVAAGYGLLTIKIMRRRSPSWLISRCTMATFLTFFVVQFLNLAGWSANYNVARWEKDRTRKLDLCYITNLGPAGWPAVRKAADEGANWPRQFRDEGERFDPLQSARAHEASWPEAQFSWQHWREFSLRASWNRGALDEPRK